MQYKISSWIDVTSMFVLSV